MLNAILKNALKKALLPAVLMVGLPTAAFAHPRGFHVDVIVPPCDPVPQRIWIPAVYRDVTEKVWVEPVTTTQMQQVEVPAQYTVRNVMVYDIFGRGHLRRVQVQISPAHCEEQPVQVVVTPGYFEMQTHQELVCQGHWQTEEPAHGRLEILLPF